jgi:DnaJ-class molecular chaperone
METDMVPWDEDFGEQTCPECEGTGDGILVLDDGTEIDDLCPLCKGNQTIPMADNTPCPQTEG